MSADPKGNETNSQEKTTCEVVVDLYVHACNELFATYGLTARIHREEAERRNAREACFVSILGASGEKIRLLSTLNISTSLLADLHPAGVQNASQRDLEDWCRELNNQLVGRLKNKLLRLGCEVMTGLPSLITGTGVSMVNMPDLDMRQYFFASAHGSLTSTLAMLLAPGIELKEVPSAPGDDAVKPEGAMSLF